MQQAVITDLNYQIKNLEEKMENLQISNTQVEHINKYLKQQKTEKEFELELLTEEVKKLEKSEMKYLQLFHKCEDKLQKEKNKGMQQYLDYRKEKE